MDAQRALQIASDMDKSIQTARRKSTDQLIRICCQLGRKQLTFKGKVGKELIESLLQRGFTLDLRMFNEEQYTSIDWSETLCRPNPTYEGITADEAALIEKSLEVDEFTDIMKDIVRRASTGYFNYVWPYEISVETSKKLQDLGYKTRSEAFGCSMSLTMISWRQK